jgi:hypothetical protein
VRTVVFVVNKKYLKCTKTFLAKTTVRLVHINTIVCNTGKLCLVNVYVLVEAVIDVPRCDVIWDVQSVVTELL